MQDPGWCLWVPEERRWLHVVARHGNLHATVVRPGALVSHSGHGLNQTPVSTGQLLHTQAVDLSELDPTIPRRCRYVLSVLPGQKMSIDRRPPWKLETLGNPR